MSNRVHRYPYHQNVSSAPPPPINHQGNHHHRPHHHHPHRNAWSAECGSNSSSSGRASGPYAAQQSNNSQAAHRQQPGSRHSQHYTHEHAVQAIVRPATPASSHGYSITGQGGCGGHCSAFDNFCNIFLQVAYSLGIITGVGLVIAGLVLGGPIRPNGPQGELFVLVYIGALTALVSTFLLFIQCTVRRNVRQRRAMIARGGCGTCNAYNSGGAIGGGGGGVGGGSSHRRETNNRPIPLQEMARKPLLAQLAHHTTAIDNQRHQSHHSGHHLSGPPSSIVSSGIYHEPYNRSDSLDVSRSGTPWWRREQGSTLNSGNHPRHQPHTAPGWR